MICPHCQGSKQTGPAFISSTRGHYMGRLPCPTCRATGRISQEHAGRIEIGRRMCEERRGRRATLREEGTRLGVDFPEWSRIEAGHFPETEAGEDALTLRLCELQIPLPPSLLAQSPALSAKRSELIAKHGTPSEFEAACMRAWLDGFVTFEEAQAAVDKYDKEYAEAQ